MDAFIGWISLIGAICIGVMVVLALSALRSQGTLSQRLLTSFGSQGKRGWLISKIRGQTMNNAPSEIPDDRDLTAEEKAFVAWLLNNGDYDATGFLSQLENARVRSRCSCGCASINFAICGQTPRASAMMIVADYKWQDSQKNRFGAFVFAQEGLLSGLDLWSIDGQATASVLPPIDTLVPIGPLIKQTQ